MALTCRRVGGVLGELLPDGTLVDGELVALGSAAGGEVGQDFDRLGQKVFGRHDHALTFVVFDALQVAGEQLTERPWHERRAALEDILAARGRHVCLPPARTTRRRARRRRSLCTGAPL